MSDFQFPNEYKGIVPGSLIGGLERYFNEHIETGSFLRAVLENDLKEAVARGDVKSQWALVPLVEALHHHAPRAAWGSRERVAKWLSQSVDEYSQDAEVIEMTRGELVSINALFGIFDGLVMAVSNKAESDEHADACAKTSQAISTMRERLKTKLGK